MKVSAESRFKKIFFGPHLENFGASNNCVAVGTWIFLCQVQASSLVSLQQLSRCQGKPGQLGLEHSPYWLLEQLRLLTTPTHIITATLISFRKVEIGRYC